MSAKKGTFAANTVTGNQVISGLGFTPAAVIFWGTLQTTAGDASHISAFHGWGAEDGSEGCVANYVVDVASPTDSGAHLSSDAAILLMSSSTVIDGEASFVSVASGQFTINWSNAPGSAWLIHYLAIEADSAHAGTFSMPDLGAEAITGVGFQPELLLTASSAVALNTTEVNASWGLGAGVSSTSERTVSAVASDNDATSIATVMQAEDSVALRLAGGGAAYGGEADLTSLDPDGFTINVTQLGTPPNFIYLAIKGGTYAVGTLTQPTAPGNEVITGLGFTPEAILLAVSGATSSGAFDAALDAKWGIGGGDGTDEGCIASDFEDNVAAASADATMRTSTTKALAYIHEAGTLAEADHSLQSDGFTLAWTTADAIARKGMWIAFTSVEPPPIIYGEPGTLRRGFAASRVATFKVAPPDDPGNELPCTGGSVSYERGDAAVHARCSLNFEDLALVPEDADSLLAPFGQELQVWREGVSLGIFRNIDVNVSEAGEGVQITLEGLDRASRIIDEPFDVSGSVAAGTDYVTTILEAVQGAWGAVPYDTNSFVSGEFQVPRLIWTEGDDRWNFAQNLATAIGRELLFDRDGILIMRLVPAPTALGAFEIVEGEGGVLLSAEKSWSRDEAANRWIVTGESTEETPVRGEAKDEDPDSPTYYDAGDFGKVTRFESYEFINTAEQCTQAATGLLNQNLGIAQNISFGAIVNPELDVGDSILITRERLGLHEVHLVDSLTIPLSATESMSGTTRKVQILG